jgi:hypothetical protein
MAAGAVVGRTGTGVEFPRSAVGKLLDGWWNAAGIMMDEAMTLLPFDGLVFHPAFGSADVRSAWPRPP